MGSAAAKAAVVAEKRQDSRRAVTVWTGRYDKQVLGSEVLAVKEIEKVTVGSAAARQP